MKLLLLLFVHLTVTTAVVAQCANELLFGARCTFVMFVYKIPSGYPVFWDAVVLQDTVSVDVSELDSFVESLFRSALYVPVSDVSYQRGFDSVFGYDKRCCDYGRLIVTFPLIGQPKIGIHVANVDIEFDDCK